VAPSRLKRSSGLDGRFARSPRCRSWCKGQRATGATGAARDCCRTLSVTDQAPGPLMARSSGSRDRSTPEAVAPESLAHRWASSHAAKRSWANGCVRYQQRMQSRRALAPRVSRGEPASGRRACFRPIRSKRLRPARRRSEHTEGCWLAPEHGWRRRRRVAPRVSARRVAA
jgi:hypothetical protein